MTYNNTQFEPFYIKFEDWYDGGDYEDPNKKIEPEEKMLCTLVCGTDRYAYYVKTKITNTKIIVASYILEKDVVVTKRKDGYWREVGQNNYNVRYELGYACYYSDPNF
jgi:hypothetical protein